MYSFDPKLPPADPDPQPDEPKRPYPDPEEPEPDVINPLPEPLHAAWTRQACVPRRGGLCLEAQLHDCNL
jgi:hypothetical protein